MKTLKIILSAGEYSSEYELLYEGSNIDTSKIKIRNINTGQIETDSNIISKAMFANIWLSSAGIKWTVGEKRSGIRTCKGECRQDQGAFRTDGIC